MRKIFVILFLLFLSKNHSQNLTPPINQDVPANTTGHLLTGTYSMSGYDASSDYSVVISLEGNTEGATFSIVTTSGLSFPGLAFPTDLTDVTEAYFFGSPADIESALNSMTFTTTNVADGEIRMHVYIYPYLANTIFNPGNGHIYTVFSNQSISWADAVSASSSSSFGDSTGYLATVTSQEEQDFFYRLNKSVWLGLSDEASEGTFEWVTGPESGTVIRTPSGNVPDVFEKWASGQPNNNGGNEHYVGFYRPSGQYYGWRDYEQTSNEIYGYVTEYGTSTSGMSTDLQVVQTSLVVLTQKRYLTAATIADIPAYTLVSGGVEPPLEIDYFGTTLVSGTDYTAIYSNNTSPGTATVTVTGIGDYTGSISTTFEVVEFTPPINQDVPANTTGHLLTGTYSMSGYDASSDYSVVISLEGNTEGATFSIVTTSGLSFPGLAFPTDLTDVTEAYFFGSPADIESALNSMTFTTTNVADGEIRMHVYIYPYLANTIFNPGNGHIYTVFSNQSISWADAVSASSSSSFGDSTGYLATVTSQEEQDFFYRLNKSVWLGLSDEASEGTFEWVTGPESGTVIRTPSGNVPDVFEKWASGQPNNNGGNEHYVGFYRPSGQYYGWRDYEQTSNEIYGYVTEYGTSTSGMSTDLQVVQTSLVVLTQKRYLTAATIADIPAYTLVSGGVEPPLEIDYFGTTLVSGTDYTAIYSNNTSPGTATVTVTGIGDYTGSISTTFEVVEFTPPINQNVPLNTDNWSLISEFDFQGYNNNKNYKAAILLLGDENASFSINQTSGLTFDFGFNDWTEILGVNFIGSPSDIENALNSIKINTSHTPGDLKLRVFITSQIADTFLNPHNGHIYEYVSGQTTWVDADSSANDSEYEDVSGYITTLTSELEDNFVSNNVNASNFWIGLSDAADEGEWYWVTGPESGTKVWSYEDGNITGFSGIINGQWCNWVTNDPNNATFNCGTGQDYAVAKFEGNTEWNDINNCDTRNDGYVIEYGTWTDAMSMTFYSTQKSEIILTQIQQGVTITEPTTTHTEESGTSLEFDVELTVNPLGDVIVPFSVSDVSEASLSSSQLTFTSSNWDIPQTITVTGTDDELFDGEISFQLISGDPTSNADSNYDNLGEEDVDDFSLTNEDNDGISISETVNISCFGSNDGSATVSINSGSSESYTYSWSDGSTIVSTSSTASSLTPGVYTVTVNDSESNSVQESVTITEPQELSGTISYVTATNDLSNGSITINVTGGTEPYSYLWNDGQTSATISSLEQGEYTVIITDNNDCNLTINIALIDSDNDGIIDNEEGSDEVPPTDTDGDGVPDYLEDNTSGDHTNPNNDSDSDGYGNSDEIAAGTDPLDGADVPTDTDGDGVSDATDTDDDNDGTPDDEDAFPLDPSEDTDTDGDGLGDNSEGYNSSDPTASTDTDGDGVADYLEDNIVGDHTNPNNDSDGDGYSNIDEINGGSDPLDPNSTLSIYSAEQEPLFILYPNPVEDVLIISTTIDEPLDIHLYDISGKLVVSKLIESERALDLMNLDSGVYILQIKTKTKSEIFKIVKE